jgi:glycopeptide antibiotics resistance protein
LTIPSAERVWSDGRICRLAALTVAVFIVYGSLVPFDLRRPDALNPGTWLEQVRFTPWSRVSRTDLLCNIAVGVPLGFFLMGAWRSGRRRSYISIAVLVLVVGGLSMLLGTTVELLQVLSPTRQSSWNDVLAQGSGAGVGALGWVLAGPGVILWLRRLAHEREASGFAARLLQLYLPIYLLVQLTPVDTIRADELLSSHQQGGIALLPSADSFDSTVIALREFGGNTLLNVPIGMFAVLGWLRRGTRRPVWRAVLLGFSIVLLVEVAQDFVWWRHGALADVLAGTLGIAIGIAAVTTWLRLMGRDSIGRTRLIHLWFVVAAGAWTFVLVGQSWHPSDLELTAEIGNERLIRMSLIPFAFYRLYAANPLQAVHEGLLKFLFALPLGFLLRMAWPVPGARRTRRFQNAGIIGVGIVLLAGVEVGQMFLSVGFPDATDVLIGTIGVIAGIAVGTVLGRGQATARGIGRKGA